MLIMTGVTFVNQVCTLIAGGSVHSACGVCFMCVCEFINWYVSIICWYAIMCIGATCSLCLE